MIQSIEGRELITLDGSGIAVHGTYHRPFHSNSVQSEDNPIGILFLNSLSLPRTATGDSAVYWADSLAACGYPCFRIDLPGLGDSYGDLPVELLDFINAGGFASIASARVVELVQRFNLPGVVIVGHCAGAVSALYTAAKCPECKGLVLMDAYFHLPQAMRPKVRQKLSSWALHSRLGRFLSDVYDRIRKIRLRLQGNRLPENANFPVLRRWKELSSTGLPILIVKAPARKAVGTKPRIGEFDYLDYILKAAGPRMQVAVEFVDGTDHSFANRRGRTAVRERIDNWLNVNFPLPSRNNLHGEVLATTANEDELAIKTASRYSAELHIFHGKLK